jgi:uncharacterized protein involved in type VI secretion and phage assembly
MTTSSAITEAAIKVAGTALDSTLAILSIDITKEVNRIPTAEIEIAAQGPVAGRAAVLSGGSFALGAPVTIGFRQAELEVTVFAGVVTGLAVRLDGAASILAVTLKDKAVALHGARRNKVWHKVSDLDVIQTLVREARLTAGGSTTPTQPVHAELVQFGATDWDFILTRADAQGLVVVVDDGAVALKTMAVTGPATRTFVVDPGEIDSAEFELNALQQYPALSGTAWDPKTAALTQPTQASILALPQGGIGAKAVGGELGYPAATLAHPVPMVKAEVEGWVKGRMARNRLALMRGRLSVPGLSGLKPMEVATLEGLGQRFDGKALVTGIRHRLDSDGFRTHVQFGLTPEPCHRLPELAALPAGGLLPPISGLQLGVVVALEGDPDNEERIRVSVPALGSDAENQLWARVATPDAGKEHGFCFRPDPGDEVAVGFVGNDPRHPVVLGRLYGSRNPPPAAFSPAADDNLKKGIVSRSGTTIAFVDGEKPSIAIKTKSGNQVLLDEESKTVTVTDQSGNAIKLSDAGITITSAKDFTIKASGKVKITGSAIDLN